MNPVQRIVIAGGGTAGWLSACLLGAWRRRTGRSIDITLVEAPDIPTIGVGEGTWPTMRETLASIGIDEAEFLSRCDASFKQGSRFIGWVDGADADRYDHPFTAPPMAEAAELVAAWAAMSDAPFASAMSVQPALCDAALAPRQRAMPPYAGAVNYAYHLDAAKLAALLRDHAVDALGVRHVSARIDAVEGTADGDIGALLLSSGERVDGDLFLDCTGLRALLIEGHCKAGWTDFGDVLFNDRALAMQVPVEAGSPIASVTQATAHCAGWLWDIALPTRRGIGCVYSSRHLDDDAARTILDEYVRRSVPGADPAAITARAIQFPTGHRRRFWVGNCLSVGLSAGFIEPLEASAIVLIELSLKQLTSNFPASRERMDFLADRFNDLFTARWQRIVEFLKLHYVLSRRDDPYWLAHRDPAHFPARLVDLLALWKDQPPSASDLPLADEVFPAASYQYVYYGMGGTRPDQLAPPPAPLIAQLHQIEQRRRALVAALPANRQYFDALATNRQPLQGESAA